MARPNVSHSSYLRELGQKLHPAIHVFWTGPDIISSQIPVDSIRELRSVLRRPPVLWDNLYANDYDMRRLHIGPYAGRPHALKNETIGVLLNPNCQCHANFAPIRTFAAWVHAQPKTNPLTAWNRAIRAWLAQFKANSHHRVTFTALRVFCDFLYLPTSLGPAATQFLNDLQTLSTTPPIRWGAEFTRVRRTSRLVLNMFDKMLHIENRDLLHAVYAHAWELKERVLLIHAWTTWRKANPETIAKDAPVQLSPALFQGNTCAQLDRFLEKIFPARTSANPTAHSNR